MEDFDADVAIEKMQFGWRWPREEYMKSEHSNPPLDLLGAKTLLEAVELDVARHLISFLEEVPLNKKAICSEMCRVQQDLELVWENLMSCIMLSNAEIKALWNEKRDKAARAGTWMHSMFEHLLNGHDVFAPPMNLELETMLNFLSRFEETHFVYRTEWTIYAEQEDIAGSIDLVLKNKCDGSVILVDWKRSEKLPDKYRSPNAMKPPLQYLMDCQGDAYKVQLSVYRWILEKYYGERVQSCFVCCTHPNFHPDGFVHEVERSDVEIEPLMFPRRCQIQSAAMGSAIPPTEAFDVHLPETHLTMVLNEQDAQACAAPEESLQLEDIHSVTKKRRLTQQAQGTRQRFHDLLQAAATAGAAFVSALPEHRPEEARRTILQQSDFLMKYVQGSHPDWPKDFVRLVAAALSIYRTRYSDLFIRDTVALLWQMEGEDHLRVHDAICYLYHDHGAFEALSGVPPESTFARIKSFLLALEGIFRLLADSTARNDASVVAAISNLLQQYNSVREFITAAMDTSSLTPASRGFGGRRRPQPVDEGGAGPPQGGWPGTVADMIARISGPMQKDLLDERSLFRYLIAWCETPSRRRAGVAYADTSLLYDVSPGRFCTFVEPSPDNDIYVRIPHNLRDPVLEDAKEALQKFYSQTFWCNEDFFKCCLAAIALAKRGENIDRCFIGESGGGTGQGLYSQHLAAVYKHNHAFIDSSLWHNEDELRKQLELFAGAWILTAQEKPDSHRKFREDLYKKLVSGDDLAARRPYGYFTRMLRVVGWKRVETNDLLEFKNVSEENFNSIFRRSLVWVAKALFLDEEYIKKHYPDAS